MRGNERRGMILIGALVLLFILSTLVSAAAVSVRVSYKADKRFSRTSLLGHAVDAGVAWARARISTGGPEPLDFEGTLQEASFEVRGKPVGENKYSLHVVSSDDAGQKARCRVTLRVESRQSHHATRVLRYEEPGIREATFPTE